jgi:hypothetical protein
MSGKKDQARKKKVSKVKLKSKFARLYLESLKIVGRHDIGYPDPSEIVI